MLNFLATNLFASPSTTKRRTSTSRLVRASWPKLSAMRWATVRPTALASVQRDDTVDGFVWPAVQRKVPLDPCFERAANIGLAVTRRDDHDRRR